VTRLLRLVVLLQSGKGSNVNSLATECGVTRRTIFRDLEIIREAGLPLEYQQEFQVYRLPASLALPPTQFTAEEALATIVLCGQLREATRFPFPSAARSVATKLESVLPAKLREHLRDANGAIEQLPQPTSHLDNDHGSHYRTLVAAISARRALRMSYRGALDAAAVSTKIWPYRLLWSRHSWYVIARSSLHRGVRTFHVGRIEALTELPERFKIPTGFRIERYLRNAWHLIPEAGDDHTVRLQFSSLVARNVADVVWHRTQQVRWNDDGSLHFEVTVSGLNEISWWILGYGDQVQVLEPPKLREMIAARIAKMAALYGGMMTRCGAEPCRMITN
jgi:proteasome accessory factor B